MNQKFRRNLIIVGVILILPSLLVLERARAFQKYICSPKPKSVSNVQYEDNGFFMMLFEPVVKIGFSASKNDISTILEKKKWQFIEEDSNGFSLGRDGPPWWKPHSGTLYRIVRPEIDVTEFLLIDQTGTNVFYLLWGI